MSAQAGENMGEPILTTTVASWVDEVLKHLPGRERVRLEPAVDPSEVAVRGPRKGLSRALRGLLKNALQASPPDRPVVLQLRLDADDVVAEVHDEGSGMPADVLSRAGEPFFTTKVPGEGMGLGLFLTQTLAQQLGGGFELRSEPGAGTRATLRLPRAEARKEAP
jgi:two-component system sensor histidine kinase RegB